MALQQLHTCKSSFEVHAFVMMGTHLHLLFSTRRELEQYVMEEFNKNILQILLKKQASSGLETPLFSELVASFRQLLHVYKYIYRNPVEAHIAQKVEDYRYSTLCDVLGRQQPSLGVLDLLRTVHDPNRILSWLNENSAKELYYSTSAQHFF
jgi:REP element-mobilizing transposase RayT